MKGIVFTLLKNKILSLNYKKSLIFTLNPLYIFANAQSKFLPEIGLRYREGKISNPRLETVFHGVKKKNHEILRLGWQFKRSVDFHRLPEGIYQLPLPLLILTPSSRTACLSTRPTGNAPQQISPDSQRRSTPLDGGRSGLEGGGTDLSEDWSPGQPRKVEGVKSPARPRLEGAVPAAGAGSLARRPAPTARPSAGSALRSGEEEGAGARPGPALAFPSGRRARGEAGAAAAGSVCASRFSSSQTLGEHGGGGAGGGPGALPGGGGAGAGAPSGTVPVLSASRSCAARDRAAMARATSSSSRSSPACTATRSTCTATRGAAFARSGASTWTCPWASR